MKKLSVKKGDMVRSPWGDQAPVTIRANTKTGVCFVHPTQGVCGMRYRDMTTVEYTRLGTKVEVASRQNKHRSRPVWIIRVRLEGIEGWHFYGGEEAVDIPKGKEIKAWINREVVIRKKDSKRMMLVPTFKLLRKDAEEFPIRKNVVEAATILLEARDVVGVFIERDPDLGLVKVVRKVLKRAVGK